jgi:N-carbamoyl-L-amino-acid hydrolase
VVAFAEEEGQRYKATFLGSGALIGDFAPNGWSRRDADGITMRQAMAHAGLQSGDIPALVRDPAATWALSRCISSRARCSTSSTCRWAW